MGVAEQWEKGSSEGGFITMNLGISSLIRVFDDLLEYLEKEHRIDFTKLSGEELGGKLKLYLDPVISFVNSRSLEEIKKLRSFVGGSAVDRVLREFQNVINKDFDSFSPEGLAQWQKESTGMYNDPSRKLGDDMQLRIRAFIFEKIKEEYGKSDDRWWFEGIPKDIQKKCAVEKIEHGEGSEQDYLYLIDYQKVIKQQKKILLNYFTPPDLKSAKIDKRLNWFAKWNKIRPKYSQFEIIDWGAT